MPSIVFVVLVVMAMASPQVADAQSTSTWILWEKYTTRGDAETTTWEPQDGFDRLDSCRMAAQQLLQYGLAHMKATGGKLLGPVQLDGRAATFTVVESGTQRTIDARYLCFPGNFDPRPHP